MSSTKFKFTANDATVTEYLTQDQIDSVTKWQESDSFDFELHTGHETGYPVYIRPEGNTDNRNLPKFDTKNKSASNYQKISDFANSDKLERRPLTSRDREELLNLVNNNFPLFSDIAKRYYG